MRAQMMMSTREPDQVAGRPAIEITHLRKTYGTLVAVGDVSFSVAEGEIFGILGPNGAGKTTTVECATGLRSPTRRAAFGQVVLNEARVTWRRPQGLIGGLALPALLLAIFSLIPAFRTPDADLGGLSRLSVYVPILIVLGLALIAFYSLPVPLVSYRELGILRRLSTTPVPPSWLLAAQGIVNLCLAATMTLVIVVAGTALGAPAPKSAAGFVLAVLLSIAGLFPIGLVIAAVAKTTTSAGVVGRVVFFPLMFLAGLWWPRELMTGSLRTLSGISPLGAAVEAIQDSVQGQFPPAMPLLVLVAYAVVFGFLAQRWFRWE